MQLPSLRQQTSLDPNDAAEQVIRSYCGWHIAPLITEELVLDGNGERRMLLPTGQLIDVESLVIDGVLVTDFGFSRDGWLELYSGVFPRKASSVSVVIEHGYDYVPALEHIVSSMVARAAMSPGGNVVSQRAGSQAVTFASAGGEVASLPLMAAEKELLAPYKLNWGP